MKDRSLRTRTTETGFTMIEILVVVAIIAIMAAIALPAIGRFIRNYQIQAATQQVASEIQAARVKAIARNVNSGVTFYVYNNTRYWWAMEDLPSPTAPPTPANCPSPGTVGATWTAPLPITECVALHGAFQTLPLGIEFDTAPPVGGPTNDCKFWFTRLGMYQNTRPGQLAGASPPPCSGNFLTSTGGNASITVTQPATGLHGRIDITSGGRVQVIRGWQ